MLIEKDYCVNCATESTPCLHDSCSLRHYKVHICDGCESELEQLYIYNGEELCMDCIVATLQEQLELVRD